MRAEIEKAIRDVEYPEVAEALRVFAGEGKPFALPKLKPQDRSSKKQRIADLLGGMPFTSDAYPWPTGGADALHMQPVVQIDLKNAGQLLGFDFGDGLLQLWSLVGKSKESLNVVDMAFDVENYSGLLLRVIPPHETSKAPSEFFPDFSPWTNLPGTASDPDSVLFIQASEAMSIGSVISWRLSKELMYPIPQYETHNVMHVVPQPAEKSEDVDATELFEEFRAAAVVHLQSPRINNGFYLGGVPDCSDDRIRNPAQYFPLLLNIGGQVNISVIFDDKKFLRPEYANRNSGTHVHFLREQLLKAVYYYAG